MLKIVAAVRRKPGMTHAEFVDYIVNVHGTLAKADPLGLKRYVQNHVFDGSFGSNDSADYAIPFHRDSVTELYFNSADDLGRTFAHEYTRTVVGPDAKNFADLSTNEATLTFETMVAAPADSTKGTKIMHFLVATGAAQIIEAQEGWLEAHERARDAAPTFAASLQGTTRSDSVATPPESPMAAYFGGGDRKPLAVVASHWVSDTNASAFRAYDSAIFASGLFDPTYSSYLITKEVEVFCV